MKHGKVDTKRRRMLALTAGLAGLGISPFAAAQAYPERPITIVVAYPPGGQNDVAARIIAQAMSATLGQPVVVDNRAGAGGIIGAQQVANAPANGYTFLLAAINHSILATLKPNMPYSLEADFEPVGMVAAFPIFLVTKPSLPVKSVSELIAYAKANPGKLTYGSSGSGGGTHLAAELFCSMAGVNMLHVPYKGSAPAMTDLLGNHIDLMFADSPSALPHIRTGKLRPLGVSSPKRSALMPDLPTIAEGGVPGYASNSWVGLVAPKGTPPDVITKVNSALTGALGDDKVKAQLLDIGGEPNPGTPEEFGRFIGAEIQKWAKIIKDAKIPLLD